MVAIVVYAAGGWAPMTDLFFWLGMTGGFGILVLLALTTVAVIAFFARDPRGGGRLVAGHRPGGCLGGRQGRAGLKEGLQARQHGRPALRDGLQDAAAGRESVVDDSQFRALVRIL